MSTFSGPEITPSPAALCVAPTGEVFVGVDMNGSLGKGPGKGQIIRLVDSDNDGDADVHTLFSETDGVRGLLSLGDKLWVLHTTYHADTGKASGMDLVVYTDSNWDGIADSPPRTLIKGICAEENIAGRGTDHSTNGIRMGIDGWIYIAVGDFGFHNAKGTDGIEMTLLGGGIVRVRPDGSEMELYTKGLRNIYDVAIDPFMNIFTRGNTNDGGGWNVRFIHQIQSANYGYPSLFLNFSHEILPALEDVGGGSGVGAIFLSEPSWPNAYNNQALMADWGNNEVYIHRLTPDGASFTQSEERFIRVSQVTDLDVDASGRMYISAWDGATFRGSDQKGYVTRVVPKNWIYEPFHSLAGASEEKLLAALASPSSTVRLASQYEMLANGNAKKLSKGLKLAIRNKSLSTEARIAALFTYAQLEGPSAIPTLVKAAKDPSIAEWALRAATDRASWARTSNIDITPFVEALENGSARQKAVAAVSLGRIGNPDAAATLLKTPFEFPEEKIATLPENTPILSRTGRIAKIEGDLTGYQEMHLNGHYYGKGKRSDRIHWVNPKLHLSNGDTLDLLDLDWKSTNDEHGPIKKVHDLTELIEGFSKKPKETLEKSIQAPLASTISYDLPKNAVSFSAFVTVQDGTATEFVRSEFSVTPYAYDPEVAKNPHSDPDSDRILPHLSFQALVSIQAEDTILSALGGPSSDLAHWALRYIHSEKAVEGALAHLKSVKEPAERKKTLTTLARLYQQEAPYDGSWWWTTRPDTRGPYYKPVKWSASERIYDALLAAWDETPKKEDRDFITRVSDKHRLRIEKFGTFIVEEEEIVTNLDLAKILSKKGAIATTPLEDVILSLEKIKGKPAKGKELFVSQGCAACHTVDSSQKAIGPFMGQIGAIMQPHQIAEAILRPNATISQGFQTSVITTKEGVPHVGFVTGRNSEQVTMRDMTGNVTKVDANKISKEEHLPGSMMPPGLANALSLEEFASLVAYLAAMK
ncbi:MAG: c-type cytochrome [Verrucomicrobiota bacterium]